MAKDAATKPEDRAAAVALARAAVASAGDTTEPARTQRFFAQLATEIALPHYGAQARHTVAAILSRAAAEGLYEAAR